MYVATQVAAQEKLDTGYRVVVNSVGARVRGGWEGDCTLTSSSGD